MSSSVRALFLLACAVLAIVLGPAALREVATAPAGEREPWIALGVGEPSDVAAPRLPQAQVRLASRASRGAQLVGADSAPRGSEGGDVDGGAGGAAPEGKDSDAVLAATAVPALRTAATVAASEAAP